MTTLKFSCTLLTDVVLSVSPATEGSHRCLDFIPGNNFLGIAAARLYKKLAADDAFTLFHSGNVRWGDAHPAAGGTRTLHIPAALYYPKLDGMEGGCYVNYLTQMDRQAIKDKQLKQCRKGFYAFSGNQASKAKVEKTFAIKSAYDRDKRRSEDEKMFGYESMAQGTKFCFSVEIDTDDDAKWAEQIKTALCGNRQLGRSRTAQYGLVNIACEDFSEATGSGNTLKDGEFVVYADSRLIFFDQNGLLTLTPTAKQLGFEGGKIDWERSQVRTFQYAPWNSKRMAYDDDRCGIEKGSVFIVKPASEKPATATNWVGAYQNEGFGKVIYNPECLQADNEGKSTLKFLPKQDNATVLNTENYPEDTVLTSFIAQRKDREEQLQKIYKLVNEFVDKYKDEFQGSERFASQWGTIRNIATWANEKKIKDQIEKYLDHGVAKEQWERRGRKDALMKFINGIDGEDKNGILREAVINLAAMMAKECKK